MNWDAIGAVGEIIGALAVVTSLLYLAVQVRHATNVARVEAHHTFNKSVLGVFSDITKDPELHKIWRSAITHGVEPNEFDRERIGMLLYQVFAAYSASSQAAAIDSELADLSQIGLDGYVSSAFVREWWTRHGKNFLLPFQQVVNEKIRMYEEECRQEEAST